MKYYFFWKHVFGQWTIRPFSINGIEYNCCEQWMMAEKARFFNDMETHVEIMNESNPKEQKALGRKVKNFNKERWDAIAQEIVFLGNMAKFKQHPDLQRMLLDTGDKILTEASPYDPIWGIGLSARDPRAMDESQWLGTNWLGIVLMRVRAAILSEAK